MQVAVCHCWLNQHQNVPKFNVTPAEVVILRMAFTPRFGADPVIGLKLVGTSKRTKTQELKRLRNLYGGLKNPANKKESIVDRLFPQPELIPDTFADELPRATAEESRPQTYNPGLDDNVKDDELEALDQEAEEIIQRQQQEQLNLEPPVPEHAEPPRRKRAQPVVAEPEPSTT
jgi:hypothetical protein